MGLNAFIRHRAAGVAVEVEQELPVCADRRFEQLAIPPEVFRAFGLPPEERCFRYEDMLFPDGTYVDHWEPGTAFGVLPHHVEHLCPAGVLLILLADQQYLPVVQGLEAQVNVETGAAPACLTLWRSTITAVSLPSC